MATVKMISLDGIKNQTVHYPPIGIVTHDSNGVIEVEESLVPKVLEDYSEHLMLADEYQKGLSAKRQAGIKKTTTAKKVEMLDLEAEEENTANDSDSNSQVSTTDTTDDEMRATLNKETKYALQSTCEDMEFPNAEWKDLKKDDLVNYIISKSAEIK